MKRIVFLVPSTTDQIGIPSTPHVGVSSLASYVRAVGHKPLVIDLRVERYSSKGLKKKLKAVSPHFVAITSTSLRYQEVYDLVGKVSDWGWPVIYGGPHVSALQEEIFVGCEPFAAVYGEGEKALSAILEGQDISDVNGVIYRDHNGAVVVNRPSELIEDLNSLPFAAYELSKLHLYGEKKIPLLTSRGCPCSCSYCTVSQIMDKKFRARSPENVVDEIEAWYSRGYRLFGINDDNFTADMNRAELICEIIIQRKLDIAWELRTGVRVDRVNDRLLEKMKAAGCVFLAFGIESIDDSVLKLSGKGVCAAQVKKAVAAAERVGIPFSGFFMIGLPGDTFAKFLKLYQFACDHQFEEVRFYNLEPYPRTLVFEWVRKFGKMLVDPQQYLNDSDLLQNRPLFETDEFTLSERERATQMGDFLMIKKLLVKTLGKKFGNFISLFARQRHIRVFILKVGYRFAPLFRGLHFRRSVSSLFLDDK